MNEALKAAGLTQEQINHYNSLGDTTQQTDYLKSLGYQLGQSYWGLN